MFYLRYLCLIVYSGVHHLLCCVFVFVMCIVRDTGLSFNKFYYSEPEKIIFWGVSFVCLFVCLFFVFLFLLFLSFVVQFVLSVMWKDMIQVIIRGFLVSVDVFSI